MHTQPSLPKCVTRVTSVLLGTGARAQQECRAACRVHVNGGLRKQRVVRRGLGKGLGKAVLSPSAVDIKN